jgi:hypothetical protein
MINKMGKTKNKKPSSWRSLEAKFLVKGFEAAQET